VMLGRLSGLSTSRAKARAGELLERFGLTDAAGKRVGAYSGGMRRRLDLALSFVVTPEVLFLDEPTTGLDTRSRRELWAVIRSLAEAGTTVFLTTQYLEEADQLADRIAVLDGGRVVALGTATELKARVGGDTVELHDEHGGLVREVPTDGTVSDLRRALDVLDESGAEGIVTLRRPSLDDVFLALTSPGAGTADPSHIKEIA
jgi:ABC-2 type transport system ATP-binding protein